MLTCEMCSKQFERQSGGNLTDATAFKCPECAAKSLESTPSPANTSGAKANQFNAELKAIAPARPVITYALIAVCTAVFALEIVKGAGFDTMAADLAIRLGANYGPQTLSGQWWRLLTSMFLHFGFLHLFMNMLFLFVFGNIAERLMGRAGFTLLYFGTGLAGNLLSLAIHPQLVAAGASGAVFGITGGLVAYLALKKAPLGFESIKKELKSLAIFIGYNLIYSFRPGVDGMAHIGGLASGLVIAAALPRFLETPGVQPVTSPIQEKSSVNSRIAKIGIACAVAFLLAAVGIRRMQSDSIYVLTSLNRIDAGQSADVIPTLEKIVGRQPNSALAHFALGAAYIRVNRGTDAVRELNLANSSQPGNSGFQQELGAAYLLQSDFANALTILQQCLTQDPANSHARIGLAAALLGTAQYQQAADEARKVISELPNEAEPHDLLGQAEIQLGAIPDGLHELETALQINPKDADLRSRLLAEYQATGRASQYRDLAAQSSSSDKVSGSTPMKTPTTH